MDFYISVLELTYQFIVDQQPIGNKLFLQFCEEAQLAKHSLDFYKDVVGTYRLMTPIYESSAVQILSLVDRVNEPSCNITS